MVIKGVEAKRSEGYYETFCKLLIDNVPCGVGVFEAINGGEDFIVKDYNKGSERIGNRSRDEVIGKIATTAFPGIKQAGVLDLFRRVYETEEPESLPVRLYQDHRLTKWLETTAFKLPNGDVASVYRDYTERNNLSRDLTRTYCFLEEILGHSCDIIYKLNLISGTLEYISESVEQYTGIPSYKHKQCNLEELLALIHPHDRDYVLNNIVAIRNGKKANTNLEYRIRHISGDYRWFSDSRNMIRRDDNRPVAIVGNVKDITQIKQLQHKIISIGDKMRHEFSNALHDSLQQELAGIECLGKVLQQEAREYPDLFEKASLLVLLISNAKAQSSRIVHSHSPIDFQETELPRALNSLSQKIQLLFKVNCSFKWKGAKIMPEKHTSINMYLIAKEAAFNAAKHANAENIGIEFIYDAEEYRLIISDDGIGYSGTSYPSNCGLGIKLMQTRAELIGAKLNIMPRDGGGTLVICSQPTKAKKSLKEEIYEP